MTAMREGPSFGVVGAGAMGGVFGALLTEAGIATALLDVNPQLVDTINQRGITLQESGCDRTVRVPARTDVVGLDPPDAVLFFVKCQHTQAAAEVVRPLVRDGTQVVTLQNGWGNADVLTRAFGKDRIVVGVTYTSATVILPGTIRTSGPARTVLGALAGNRSLAEPVADALRRAGFPVEHPADVLSEIWKKLVLNAATLPTAGLTGLTAGGLPGSADMHWLVDTAAAEAVKVGQAMGFDVELDERLQSIHAVLERAGAGKGSMLQDVEAGRRTEIDVISGAVLSMARSAGLEVPITRALYALVTGLERARGQR
jgi:2-dehydropantoate 2-reductase